MVAVRFCPQLFRLQSPANASEAADSKKQADDQGSGAGHHCHDTASKQEGSAPQQPFQLPYRMLFAIATLDSTIIYDTQVSRASLYAKGHHSESILAEVCKSRTKPWHTNEEAMSSLRRTSCFAS